MTLTFAVAFDEIDGTITIVYMPLRRPAPPAPNPAIITIEE